MENSNSLCNCAAVGESSCYEDCSWKDEAEQDMNTFSCPKCGNANLRSASRFCDECGHKLQESKLPEQKGTMNTVVVMHNSKEHAIEQRSKVLGEGDGDIKVTKDKISGDVQIENSCLAVAKSRSATDDGVVTMTNEDASVPMDIETEGNNPFENEAFTRIDMDNGQRNIMPNRGTSNNSSVRDEINDEKDTKKDRKQAEMGEKKRETGASHPQDEPRSIMRNNEQGKESASAEPSIQDGASELQCEEAAGAPEEDSQTISDLRTEKSQSISFSRQSTGDPYELQIHFRALLDPNFGSSEKMCIVFGQPLGDWTERYAVKLESKGKYEEFEILHGVIYLRTSFKEEYFKTEYKYVSVLNKQLSFEKITRPVIDESDLGFLNRVLVIHRSEWKDTFNKFDSIVSPFRESEGHFQPFVNGIITRNIFKFSRMDADVKEFSICLRAFLPELTFLNGCCMENIIKQFQNIVQSLSEMSFKKSEYHLLKKFPNFSTENKLEVFKYTFRDVIDSNYTMLETGDIHEEFQHVLLSTVCLAYFLLFFVRSPKPCKEYLTLIKSFSLTRFHRSGVTLENLKRNLNDQLDTANFTKEITTKLASLLKQIIANDEIRNASSAWWSILALISILNEMSNEEQKFEKVETLLGRVTLSDKPKDVTEVETALYYAPILERIILSKFCFDKYHVFLKIEGLDLVMLLQQTRIIMVNARDWPVNHMKQVQQLLVLLKSKLESYQPNDIERLQLGIGNTLEMFILCLEVMDGIRYISLFRELIAMLKVLVTKAKQIIPESMGLHEGLFEIFNRGMKNIVVAAKIYFKYNYMQKNFGVACELLDLFFETDLCFDYMKNLLDESADEVLEYIIKKKISHSRCHKEILEVTCSGAANTKYSKLSKILESTIDVIIDKAEDDLLLLDYLSSRSKLLRLFHKVFPDLRSTIVLKKLLEWPAAENFIKLFANVLKVSGDRDRDQFLIAMNYFKEYERKLISGDISIRELEIITLDESRFIRISSAVGHLPFFETNTSQLMLKKAVLKRTQERDFVSYQRKKVALLKFHLSHLPEGTLCNLKMLDDSLQEKWHCVPLYLICRRENGELKDLVFELPANVQDELERMCYAFTSKIFCNAWRKEASRVTEVRLENIITSLFHPVLCKVNTFITSLLDQSITLKEVLKAFDNFDGAEITLDGVQKEVKILIPLSFKEVGGILNYSSRNIANVVKKVCQFLALQRNRKKAACIVSLGRELGLKGKFKVLEEMNSEAFSIIADLRSLHKIDFTVAKSLGHISDEVENCMTCILKSINIIKWLRENFPDFREVKTFVDLLSMSAGESDFESDRVYFLHTVCLEFEPIIFKLNAKSGPDELINCCQEISDKTSKEPQLLKTLDDCNRLLQWFKNEQDSYGSVAGSSMKKAKAVNRHGYYIIGSAANFDVQQSLVTLESSLHLYVPSQDNVKIYKLNDIKDLQSKLMLIGGQQGIERETRQIEKECFSQMFEAVTRVATLFIQLCDSGCIRYLKWHAKFTCNLKDGVDAFGKTVELVTKECARMERDLEEWKFELHRKRTQFPSLNYYTIRQLLMLQRSLKHAIMKEDSKALRNLPSQVFSLLDKVCPGTDQERFRTMLLKSSYRCRYGKKSSQDNSWMRVARADDKFIAVSLGAILKFINDLEQEGHDESVAKAATMQCGLLDRSVASVWGYEHWHNEEQIRELANQMNSVLERKKEEGSQMKDHSGVGEASTKCAGKEEIEYLPLEDLGRILDELANIGKRRQRWLKPFETMNKRKPNLMIVPKDDLLLVVIDIYKQAGCCLPSEGEVELCNHGTGLEKIELLFRRALHNPNGIYTLAFIDELDYNVAVQACMKLQSLLQERATRFNVGENDTFNLLLMCSSEGEGGSFLSSAWDKYRIVSHRCPRREQAAEFLKKQLLCNPRLNPSDYVYAATADVECSTVRVIKSHTAGMGKSLFIRRVGEKLESLIQKSKLATKEVKSKSTCFYFTSVNADVTVTTSLQGTGVDQDLIAGELIAYDKKKKEACPRVYHFDIASTVTSNLDSFMFQLLIIGSVSTTTGSIWKKKPNDLYIIEITEPIMENDREIDNKKRKKTNIGNIIPLLPTTVCRTPNETLEALKKKMQICPGFDEREYSNKSFQRVCRYLGLLENAPRGKKARNFQSGNTPSYQNCLEILLKYCGVANPSWREIKHFVHFFNNQLLDCENSVYCNQSLVGDSLPDFKSFVVKFMLQMSKDFATPSASEESKQEYRGLVILRRRWEKSEHPYLFFNQDRQSMSFLGFTVNINGDLMDKENKRFIQRGIMTRELYQGLKLNGVELFARCTKWNRSQKLEMLCKVMGVEAVRDPDSTYELTIDNMMKILAIHMRFRCGIPVILMGETGCGKTRLIRFMCNLKAGPSGLQNMILVKVHGGVTENDIKKKVKSAIKLAEKNHGRSRTLETVLFFDEANTTSAIGLIKEIMCDRRMAGKPLNLESCGLKIIAACNPYRKHTDEMIEKLESAGLGYYVKSEDASEKIGNIPLRQLVYRVHKLPESMLPLVWDFGQLSIDVEILYASQIVRRYARESKIPEDEEFVNIVVATLAASQIFMREQKDECSFVSLRDVERGVQVLAWFYSKMKFFYRLIEETKKKFKSSDNSGDDGDVDGDDDKDDGYVSIESENKEKEEHVDKPRLALVLSLSMCYAARLEKRESYYKKVASEFKGQYKLEGGYKEMETETFYCQRMFLDQLQLGENIAKNAALSENVFMMVVCIELRIPLFVVGKPGSSKSLAKAIVQDNMQGALSRSNLFKQFKQTLMSSYQCSPLSTAEGIITTFRQCSRFQEGKDLNRFVSVVVLDEVGLAEDSPRMPLKALHPLLEDGTDGSEDLTIEGTESKAKRVAFIGISNWALDPAKMNRGLMLTRDQPDRKELLSSAEGICNSNKPTKNTFSRLFIPLAEAYSKIYEKQRNCERLKSSKKEEFFGLRDYYSLIKMIFNKAIAKRCIPNLIELEHAVKRNFGGLEDFDTWSYFYEELKHLSLENESDRDKDAIDVSPVGLLKSCLHGENSKKDTRYVLLMTENYAALRVLEKKFPKEYAAASVIFGSSFPKDQEFTQICRDINKIKICMETGMPVILLNMENLYESLYDALNQYYVYLGGQRYVDLGLGSHRVKCRVHENFNMIVVAEKSTVYNSFPIPLINRLEKHFLVMSTSLNERQRELSNIIYGWAEKFSALKFGRKQYSFGDSFIGFNEDTPSAVLLETLHDLNENADDELILDQCKRKLLEVAAPEAVARIQRSHFGREASRIWDIYFKDQSHGSLESFLQSALIGRRTERGINIQVTTFSRLLSPHDFASLEKGLGNSFHIKSILLNQFQTEQQFSGELRRYIKEDMAKEKMLILQCDNGDENSSLLASARHLYHQSILTHGVNHPLHMIFIVNLKRVAHGCQSLGSFLGVNWRCVHIDELRPPSDDLPSLIPYSNNKMSSIFERFGNIDTYMQDDYCEMEKEITIRCAEGTLEERNIKTVIDVDNAVIEASKESLLSGNDTTKIHAHSGINIADEAKSTGLPPIPMAINSEAEHSKGSHVSNRKVSFADSHGKTAKDERNLLLAILRRCVQPAVVQTATSKDLGSRLTKRIHMLLVLLSSEFQGSDFNYQFATVLLRIIYKFLREKESQAIEDKQWFHDEATTGNKIQECGTFRRALSYRIEKEVIPVLSHIISQIDVNSNLDLLTENEDWKRGLWLDFFSSEEFIRLEELSIVQRQPMKRKKTDASLVCWFPFSSAIRDKLMLIIQEHIRDEQSNEADGIVRAILKQSPTGHALLRLTPRQLKSYLRDLVFLEYDVNSEEHELITASILCRARRKKNIAGTVSIDIVDIHVIINQPAFRQRIRCFLLIIALIEDTTTKLMRLIEDSDDIIVDVLALQKGLENLESEIENIQDTQGRFVWTANVQEIKLAANQLFTLLDSCEDEFSANAKKILNDARIRWTRIHLSKIFIDHVCPPGIPCMPIDTTAALQLFDATQLIDDDMASASSWQKIEATLVQLNDIVQSAYSNGRKPSYKLESFKERCMSFFMEAVSTFLFSSTSHTIEDDVVELMMSYVTTKSRGTKEMTPFSDYKVDSTPTMRSFLVQQLLKARDRIQLAENFLQIYLDEANYSRKDDEESRLELCLLLIHCYEDFKMAYISKISKQGSQLEYVCRLALDRRDFPMNIGNIDTLRQIACFRVFICKVVEVAYCDVIEKKYKNEYRQKLNELYSLLQSSCIEDEGRNLREFFLRQFIRMYGLIKLKQLIANEKFNWLWPEEDNEAQNELHDRFSIYGDGYRNLREKIGEAVMKKSIAGLNITDVGQGKTSGPQIEAFVFLALYREVTTLYSNKAPNATFCKAILQFLTSSNAVKNLTLARMLIRNKQGGGFEMLKCSPKLEQQYAELTEIVIHALIVFSLKPNSPLLRPLVLLADNPSAMINAYLPTMPSDHLEVMFDAAEDKWQCYECPNGHPYVITECGRPVQQYKCIECNAEIGGLRYKLSSGNTISQRGDRTKTGYILGNPNNRIDFPITERELQPVSHSLLSVLLHAALLLGACKNAKAVSQMIHPQQTTYDVREFLWEHLQISLKVGAKSLRRSVEETTTFVHLVLKNMLEEDSDGTNENFGSLHSKESRNRWEEKFNIRHLLPLISSADSAINSAQREMINDKRMGSNSLMKRLYEQDLADDLTGPERHAFDYVQFWRYRVPITVFHLQCSLQKFTANNGKSTCQILQKFLDKVEVLSLVKNLPDIVKLQCILSRKLSRQLSSESAEKETIKKVTLKHFKDKEKQEIDKLLKMYYATWRALKPSLLSNGWLSQTDDYELTGNSPIGYVLPSTNSTGKRAVLMVSCLAEAHNEIVAERRKIQGDQTNSKSVPTQDVTLHHLVAFDHDMDLIPMFYAHCSYSLEIGKGTTIDYNFPALERQLVTTFIAGKPMLDIGVLMVKYADDIKNLEKFEELQRRIEQRQIPYADQLQMTAEFHDLAEVCDALRAVEIAIGLLSSTGAEPNYFYKNFLDDIRMDPITFLVSVKMQSVCRVTHIRSIWTMLTVERAYRLHVNRQDPFDLREIFRDEVESFDEQLLRSMDLEHLLAELTEYIILEVPRREENAIDMQLEECLCIFMDNKKSTKVIKGIEKLPSSLCLKHIFSFWKIVADARKTFKNA